MYDVIYVDVTYDGLDVAYFFRNSGILSSPVEFHMSGQLLSPDTHKKK